MRPTRLLAASAALALPTTALGDDKDTRVAITLSPLHLILPVVELTGEFKVAERASVAVIGGAGRTSGVSLWELGAQGRFFLLGDFADNVHVGAEALYAGGASSGLTAAGFSPGAFVGGKTTFDFGLVLDGQVGGAYYTSSGDGELDLLLNLNLGWAF